MKNALALITHNKPMLISHDALVEVCNTAMLMQAAGGVQAGAGGGVAPYRIENTDGGASVAVHEITGGISYDSGNGLFGSWKGAKEMADEMRAADADGAVQAHILRVNSGGGEVAASRHLMNTVQNLQKPVIAYVVGDMQSGALMSALGADVIIADEGARVGSIGVQMVVSKDFGEFFNKNYKTLRANTSPDKNADFEAYVNGDYGPLVKQLDTADALFMGAVAANRPLKGRAETIQKTLSGGTFDAPDALRRGLVDALGTYTDALAAVDNQLSKTAEKRRKKTKTMANTTLEKIIANVTAAFNGSEETAQPSGPTAQELEAATARATAAEQKAAELATQLEAAQTAAQTAQQNVEAAQAENTALTARVAELETTANTAQTAAQQNADAIATLQKTVAQLTASNPNTPTGTASSVAVDAEKFEKEAGKVRGQIKIGILNDEK